MAKGSHRQPLLAVIAYWEGLRKVAVIWMEPVLSGLAMRLILVWLGVGSSSARGGMAGVCEVEMSWEEERYRVICLLFWVRVKKSLLIFFTSAWVSMFQVIWSLGLRFLISSVMVMEGRCLPVILKVRVAVAPLGRLRASVRSRMVLWMGSAVEEMIFASPETLWSWSL